MNIFTIFCVILSLTLLYCAVRNFVRKGEKALSFIAVAAADIIMFLPANIAALSYDFSTNRYDLRPLKVLLAILASMLSSLRSFGLNMDFTFITEAPGMSFGFVHMLYCFLAISLYILCPILVSIYIISALHQLERVRALFDRTKSVYIFSEHNEYSEKLAKDILAKHPEIRVIYADELWKGVDIAKNRSLLRRAKQKQMNFFFIGMDQKKNVEQALDIIDRYRDRDGIRIYVFAVGEENELLLNGMDSGKIRLRMIDVDCQMIYRELYTKGMRLFDEAIQEKDGYKHIRAFVVGSAHDSELMLRTLLWMCQMKGYRLRIDAFAETEEDIRMFKIRFPELLSRDRNGIYRDDDAQYLLRFHRMEELFAGGGLKIPTFVYIHTKSGASDLMTALELRKRYEQMERHPWIQIRVENDYTQRALEKAANYRGEKYDIDPVGSPGEVYTEKTIIGYDLETKGRDEHLKCKKRTEEQFWKYSYNYRSSIAAVMHINMRAHCGQERKGTEERRILEHRRWNAYMLSEGYRYGEKRNDIAKTHYDLVPFSKLPEEEQKKDDN